jgi:zinc finger SWIM domain-containing protein 3
MDYKCFGDAVSFDTTFQTNKFEMSFAPLLGTNHHKQTIIFGAALLLNEAIPSFVWLIQTFLIAMSGKHPSIIFIDQDICSYDSNNCFCITKYKSSTLFVAHLS